MNDKIDIIIGSTNEHLLYSILNKIPIVLTTYEFFQFEGIEEPPIIENSKIIGSELNIFKKPKLFSSLEIFEKLLFVAELRGLILAKDVFSIRFDCEKREIITFNKHNDKKTFLYKKIFILNTDVISYVQPTKITGDFSYTVFDFFKNKKSARMFMNINEEWIKEIYFFDEQMIIKHIVEVEKINEWEYSCVASRLRAEEIFMDKFKVSLDLNFLHRKTRQNWKNVLNTKQGLFEFYVIPH